jgi:hypothetical protein
MRIEMDMSIRHFPSGVELSRSLRPIPPGGYWTTVVDRSIRSCASVSRGKQVSHFPSGLWDSRRSLRHVRNTAQASRGKRGASAFFPLGQWALCRRGWHVPLPGRTRLDPNRTAKIEFGMSARHFPIGAMRNFRSLRHVHILH